MHPFIETKNKFRYFPIVQPISTDLTSSSVPNCTVDGTVGCISVLKSVPPVTPEWAGKVHSKGPTCSDQNCKRPEDLPPHLFLDIIHYDNIGFTTSQEVPGGSNATMTRSVALADINGDDAIDLIIGNENSKNQVFRNRGDGTFEEPLNLPGGDDLRTTSIFSVDWDGDGKVDYIAVGNYGGRNQLIKISSDFTFEDLQAFPLEDESFTTAIAIADINGDNETDVIVGNLGQRNKVFMWNMTSNSFSSEY